MEQRLRGERARRLDLVWNRDSSERPTCDGQPRQRHRDRRDWKPQLQRHRVERLVHAGSSRGRHQEYRRHPHHGARPAGAGHSGQCPKFLFRGPWLDNWDMALFKRIPLSSGRLKMEFRAEAYNVFNTSNFTTMDTKARFTIDTTNGNTLTQTSSTYGHFT